MQQFSLLQNWWQFVLLAIGSYLIGCINSAKLISKARHGDITKMGSGNPGTMNMFRNFGFGWGALTFVGDAVKGSLPVLVAHLLYKDFYFSQSMVIVSDFARYFAGVCVIVGHVFPCTMRFKGGKGIASTFGLFWTALSCENLWWILFGFLIVLGILLFILFSEWGSLGSLVGVSVFCIAQSVFFFFRYQFLPINAYLVWACIWMFIIEIITWTAHWQNILRLFAGEEHHTSFKKIFAKKGKKE